MGIQRLLPSGGTEEFKSPIRNAMGKNTTSALLTRLNIQGKGKLLHSVLYDTSGTGEIRITIDGSVVYYGRSEIARVIGIVHKDFSIGAGSDGAVQTLCSRNDQMSFQFSTYDFSVQYPLSSLQHAKNLMIDNPITFNSQLTVEIAHVSGTGPAEILTLYQLD